jgi:RND family efflux transporter MFP subunit
VSSRSEALQHPLAERDWGRLAAAAAFEDFATAWLALAGAPLGADRAVLVVRRPGSERFAPVAFFPEAQPCGPFLADLAERALYDGRPLSVAEGARLGIACPVLRRGRLEAIAAFEWSRAPDASPESLQRMVQWGLPWIELRLGQVAGDPGADAALPLQGALHKLLAAGGFVDAARAAATELAHLFGCERVAIGVVAEGVELAALSNTAQFDSRLALGRALAARMADAVRAGATLEAPAADGPGVSLCVLSGQLIFCFERQAPFDAEARKAAEAASAMLAPALALQRANSQPWHRRMAQAARAGYAHWFGASAGRRRVAVAAVLVALGILAFARGEFRVAGDAALEGSLRRVMTAPYDGYIASASARAGDLVKKDAVIAVLDDRDLRLERIRWASQQAQYARQLQEAAAKHERGQMQILQAQLAQAEAQGQLLDEQLRRARLSAPFDGLIVSGDLSQSVGGAVRKGDTLFELTPLSGFRVVVQVDESDIAAVAPGQKGTLLLAAITGQSFPITVTAVTPVARAQEGRNAFRVEAVLEGPGERLRPGMEGVAKIETGSRNLLWIWTHRFTNWLRLRLWSLWP